MSNSSPLIHMARLGKLRFARSTFKSLFIPPGVRKETIEAGEEDGYADVSHLRALEKEGWLVTTPLAPDSLRLAEELSGTLRVGEAEAIALARERGERLLMDDEKGRRTAEFYGVETSTTLGVILEMLKEGALDLTEYEKNVRDYASRGWIGGDVVQLFIDRGREIGR